MYKVFDSFCRVHTWETLHGHDERRYEDALEEVVYDPLFSPDAMGDYIRANHAEPMWPKSAEHIEAVIVRLVARAAERQAEILSRIGRLAH
jgi:hypothetical protein